MNSGIVRAILESSGRYIDNLSDQKDLDKIVEKLPAFDSATASALATSLADLISYKVSTEMYQRHAVKIQVIEVFREWIRLPMDLASHHIFCQEHYIFQLCEKLIQQYFQSDITDKKSSRQLITLGRMLINLAKTNHQYISYVISLVDEIEDTDCYEFVELLLQHEDELQLNDATIEKLYVLHQAKLIEAPLINCFILKSQTSDDSFFTTTSYNKLIHLASQSPRMFQIICNILKEFFIHLNYSSLALNYIQFVIKNIYSHREDSHKYIVDLYPPNLQPCVILLRIDPSYHTSTSNIQTLQILKDFYINNKNDALILMMHFPAWLNALSNEIQPD